MQTSPSHTATDRRSRSRVAWSQKLETLSPYVLSIVRIVVALLFLEHGSAKLLGFPVSGRMPDAFTLSWFSGAIELVGGALLAVGFLVRFSAFIVAGEMAVGYFMSHAPQSFFPLLNRGDAAILYCFVFFYFVFAGGGPWSLDALGQSKRLRE